MSLIHRLFGMMPPEEMAGITLRHPRWALIGRIDDPSRFLSSLHLLAPEGAWLFLEGGGHPPELLQFLEAHAGIVSPRPALGTVWPRHTYFSLPATEEVLASLARITSSLSSPEICDHLHVFSGENVLLEGHDAFAHTFFVSGLVSESRLKDLSAAIGCEYRALGDDDRFGRGAARGPILP